ncbi:AAA family ATPase [Flammeovirga sp. MY04]|uniref:AAA family ATPase n=1 Tax=Flammeovirga sp. MY04 TaxID=1191459 RepID=UPI00080613F9|nr:ATP-binding protein [Flammeovirga sp. MY04]ANQ48063.1 AAA family ATPase [Flammeovirga sp. MY04]
MRLKKLYISNYKNLIDFTVKFTEKPLEIFVGKNGSGKSNFFEVIIDVFQHLYNDITEVNFTYTLDYEIFGADVFVKWDHVSNQWLNKDDNEVGKPSSGILPENILLYYSGHNEKIHSLIKKNNSNFIKSIKSSIPSNRHFWGVGNEYKSLLLFILLIQDSGNKARDFIFDRLDVKKIGDEFVLELKRPNYALGKTTFDVDRVDLETRYWKARGLVKDFLDKLFTVNSAPLPTGYVRDEGYFNTNDTYKKFFSIQHFQEIFSDETPLQLLNYLDALNQIGMLKSIDLNIFLKDNLPEISFNQFSDGQYQMVYIYALYYIFKDTNSISILDEPDAFLHPEWQYELLNQVNDIQSLDDEENIKNHIIMSSHSALTLINYPNSKIGLIRKNPNDNNKILNHQSRKDFAINELAKDIINYSEQHGLLSILNAVKQEEKPVLFTEGITDPLIICRAWEVLYPGEETPFLSFYAFGEKQLASLLHDENIIDEMNGKPLFGLFDFDKAYDRWSGIKDSTETETNAYRGLKREVQDKNIHAFILPVPIEKKVTCQVINPTTGNTYKGNSYLTIELLFEHVEGLESYFDNDETKPNNPRKFKGNKVSFAKEIVPTIPAEHFEIFRPMFENIRSVLNVNVESV